MKQLLYALFLCSLSCYGAANSKYEKYILLNKHSSLTKDGKPSCEEIALKSLTTFQLKHIFWHLAKCEPTPNNIDAMRVLDSAINMRDERRIISMKKSEQELHDQRTKTQERLLEINLKLRESELIVLQERSCNKSKIDQEDALLESNIKKCESELMHLFGE